MKSVNVKSGAKNFAVRPRKDAMNANGGSAKMYKPNISVTVGFA